MGLVSEKIREFQQDERGLALILVSIMLPVIIGFSLLVIDWSRAGNLHNDLQKGADSFALAAAAELDGMPDAHTRADRALANLVDNSHRFSITNVQTVLTSSGITRLFLKSIPDDDATALNSATGIDANGVDHSSAGPAETRFILVNVIPTGFAAIFPASFLTGNTTDNGFNVGATAVAGFSSGVCDFTPVFICNPYENPADAGDVTLQQAIATREHRRRLIELRAVEGGADYFPGNFGFLESPEANGAKALAEMIACSNPPNCYSSRGVTTKTGQNSGPVKGAFNVRFGIREPGSNFNGPLCGPAQNVRKGASQQGGGCPASTKLTYGAPNRGLAPDGCFVNGTPCPYMGGKMGAGDWDFRGYWDTVHPGEPLKTGWSYTGQNMPTRYEVYDYETTFEGGRLLNDVAIGGAETGHPPNACGAPVTTEDRRLIFGAIINCQALEVAGYNLSGHEENLPVEAFASFFLTEPVRKEPHSVYDASVFVELVDVTGRAGGGTLDDFLRDEVQLYR
jgi:Flp pilus assembly protein TadG